LFQRGSIFSLARTAPLKAAACRGLILLDELDYLVAAGLSRQQALHAATPGAAVKAGAPDFGYAGEGAIADLVLLRGNPSEDMATLQEPSGTISAGTDVDRDALLALRADAAQFARPVPAAE